MKAAILNQFGNASELQVTHVAKPVANKDQVLIKVMGAGINPVDTKVRAGTSAMSKKIQLPEILGFDVSGIAEATGEKVSDFKSGDAVFGCIGFPDMGRAYAEYAIADPKSLVKKPNNITFEEAAAVSLAGLTAYQAINEHIKLQPKQTILIQAAAGGVGHFAVQFAKLEGAYISGTASNKNAEFLKSLGVDKVIDYKNEKFEDLVSNLDAVLDAMGGEILYRSIACVKPGGTVVCLPSSTKDDPKAIELAKKHGIKLIWPMMHADNKQLQRIADLLAQDKLKVHIDKVFNLDQIVEAHKAVESHSTKGKIVVEMV